MATRTKSKMDDKYLHVFRRIINIIILAVVGMMILSALGVQITPLIASLGIGGLAIALALQDTLANFFSGFYMISDRAVQIGDYVEIDAPGGTIKGVVEDIGWRTSKLKTLTDNHVIVPNSQFANATVINYQAPRSEMSLIIPVGVSYNSDLEKVERVTNEVIKDTLQNVEGGVKDFEPLIRYREFADSSINLIAILRITEPVKQGLIRHEFVKRLKKRYDKEGIEIPFPQRDIHMKK
jgi:small-conductance mechanosensitive channel